MLFKFTAIMMRESRVHSKLLGQISNFYRSGNGMAFEIQSQWSQLQPTLLSSLWIVLLI